MIGKRLVWAVLLALFLVACTNPDTARKKLVETGNKYFNSEKYKEASIIYRKAIQRDPLYGEAYYRLALTELRLGRYGDALRALRRASELQPENDDAHAKLGDLYLSIYLTDRKTYRNFLTDFVDLSDRLLKRDPKSFHDLRMKGYIALANEQVSEAVQHFSQANEVKPGEPTVVLALVQSLAANRQPREAEKTALAFLERSKFYGPVYDFLHTLYTSEKRPADAENILKLKIQNNPKSAGYTLQLAAYYYRTGQFDRVEAVLNAMTSNTKDFPNGYLLAGEFYYRVRNYDEARLMLNAGMKAFPNDKLAYQKRLVEVLAAGGQRADALQLTDAIIRERPEDSEAKALRGSLRLQDSSKQDIDAAVAEMQSIIANMPDNPVLRYNLGEAYMARGELDQARVQFHESLKLRSTFIPPKLALARIHLMKREFPLAIQVADSILAQSPKDYRARLIRASAQVGLDERATARAELEVLLKENPDLRDPYYLLGTMDYVEKKYPEAEARFRHLYNANPPDLRGLFGLVECALATNRSDMARQLLHEQIKKTPNNRAMLAALANVAVRSQRYDDAIAEFKKLIAEFPNSAELYMNIGETYRRAKRWDEALAAFRKAKGIEPQNVTPLLQIAVVLESIGRKSEVRPIYEEILKLTPDNAVALNNLAYMLAESGTDLDQALTYAQRARQKLPQNLDIADTLGWVYIRKNLSDNAITIYKALLAGNPGHVTWRYHLAMALYQKGDKLQAKKELQTALKNNPSKEEHGKIQELLNRIG